MIYEIVLASFLLMIVIGSVVLTDNQHREQLAASMLPTVIEGHHRLNNSVMLSDEEQDRCIDTALDYADRIIKRGRKK
jgi:hypothetical protein